MYNNTYIYKSPLFPIIVGETTVFLPVKPNPPAQPVATAEQQRLPDLVKRTLSQSLH